MRNPNWDKVPNYSISPMRFEYRSNRPYIRRDLERALEVVRELSVDAW